MQDTGNEHTDSTETSNVGFNLISWMRLARISAAPSAVSNILVGYLIAHGNWQSSQSVCVLVASSLCLYIAGMISNDVFDRVRDKETNPDRPLITGAIPVGSAQFVYISLMILGIILAAIVGLQSLVIATVLTICILLYNKVLKSLPIAPVVMGMCRSLNILLGASYVAASQSDGTWATIAAPSAPVLWISVSLGVLITGLTYFARRETEINNRTRLVLSSLIILIGVIGISAVALATDPPMRNSNVYILMILLISLPVCIRYLRAIKSCNPRDIKFAIIALLRSLIVLDAAVCFLFGQPEIVYALVVISLILPSTLLGKWISAT